MRTPVMRFLTVALTCFTVMLASCVTVPAARGSGSFVEREQTVNGVVHRYQVFVPARTGKRKVPVILFLHGSGERGSDNRKQITVGLGPYIAAHADDFPAIVVFPQAPADAEWRQSAALAFSALDAATREFGGDPRRTYLTGLSMGGYGTWELALQQPTRFAAIAPVCGGITAPGYRPSMFAAPVAGAADPFAETARRLRNLPVWIFHGAKDDVVPPEQSRRMAAALETAGATQARYTEFPEAGHNSWDDAYSRTPELWEWLLAQRRR